MMVRAKSLSKLVAALDYDSFRLANAIALLESCGDQEFSYLALTGIALDGREHLAFQALLELELFLPKNDLNSYTVDQSKIDILKTQIETIVELKNLQEEPLPQNTSSRAFLDLAWTLPDRFESNFDLPHKSLAGLLKLTISHAKKTLFLISPFLEKTGLQTLEGPIIGAFNRGVKIILVSHGLNDTHSANHIGYSFLKSIVPNLVAYTSAISDNDSHYFLIHAKIIVSDDKFAVLSSANLTQYGLGTHLELGVGLTGEPASQLYNLAKQIISSSLVLPIN